MAMICAVLHGDHRRAGLRVDHRARERLAGPRPGPPVPGPRARGDPGEAVAEVRWGVHGEARFGEAGDRAQQFGRRTAEQLCAQHHRFDVRRRVVVGEHRGADVLLRRRRPAR